LSELLEFVLVVSQSHTLINSTVPSFVKSPNCEYYKDNTERDVVDVEFNIYAPIKKYGPSWFDPNLPGLHHTWPIRVSDNFPSKKIEGFSIKWSVHADHAPPNAGEDIKLVDHREP
jgi:hypothetical protein